MLSVTMNWKQGLQFEGKGAFGHTLVTDASKEVGGQESGFKPTELLLYGIAGCTGIDIIRILTKQRQEVSALQIEVTGQQREQYPKPFHSVEMRYILRGRDLDADKVARAIALSEEKYCVVSQTVARPAQVTTSFEILPE